MLPNIMYVSTSNDLSLGPKWAIVQAIPYLCPHLRSVKAGPKCIARDTVNSHSGDLGAGGKTAKKIGVQLAVCLLE